MVFGKRNQEFGEEMNIKEIIVRILTSTIIGFCTIIGIVMGLKFLIKLGFLQG